MILWRLGETFTEEYSKRDCLRQIFWLGSIGPAKMNLYLYTRNFLGGVLPPSSPTIWDQGIYSLKCKPTATHNENEEKHVRVWLWDYRVSSAQNLNLLRAVRESECISGWYFDHKLHIIWLSHFIPAHRVGTSPLEEKIYPATHPIFSGIVVFLAIFRHLKENYFVFTRADFIVIKWNAQLFFFLF